MMLFDDRGTIYEVIVPIEEFFTKLTVETFKTIYSINFYYFFIECSNRFQNDVRCDSKIALIDDIFHNGVRESIYSFRKSGVLSEAELLELEAQVVLKLAKQIQNISFFSAN